MSDSDSESEQLGVLEQHDEDWEDWAGAYVLGARGLERGNEWQQGRQRGCD
jgi:hypothetical protein